MWSGLRGVHDHDRSVLVRPFRERLDGIDGAERVGDEVVGDDLDVALNGERVEGIELELTSIVDRDVPESGPVRLAMYCQGTKFEWCSSLGDHHEISRPEIVETP